MDATTTTRQQARDASMLKRFLVGRGMGKLELCLKHLGNNEVHCSLTYLNTRIGNQIVASGTFTRRTQGRKSRRAVAHPAAAKKA
ncbi:MAG: hypothetical protein HYS26_04230 [Candidatus Kaiserbacteria bacterium]|nr:MAG: hypothetical protein HYS26_04230 [Candidatus Kaiserbacteria bacterium]